jgi:outer membrane protein, heavy metal efflux system
MRIPPRNTSASLAHKLRARRRTTKRLKWLVVALGLCLLPASAPAQTVDQRSFDDSPAAQAELLPAPSPSSVEHRVGLSLEQLEQMALSWNPALARAGALVGAARGTWVQSGLAPNPSVGYEGQQIGSGGLAEQHGVFFSQEVVVGGKLRLNREIAAREVAVARHDFASQ